MEKKLNAYETMYVVDASLSDEAVAAIVAKFTALANEYATEICVNEWGKRHLAYEINDKKEGYYVLVNFSAPTDFPAELERVFGITEGIMRYMVTRVDA